jgi:hypothetical protein
MTTAPKILTATVVRRNLERSSLAPGRYVWRGPASDPVFALQNCNAFRVQDIDVTCDTPTSAVFLIERTQTGPGTIPSTMHMFRNVRIFGNRKAERGVWYRNTIDENNEHGRFDCVSVYGCTLAGFAFYGQQSKEHLLTHVRTESCTVGVIADSAFQWIGGTCAVAEYAIFLARIGDPVTIQGVGFEACQRLLLTYGPTTAAQPVTFIGGRYEADQLAEDGEAIVLQHAGPLNIIGMRLGGGKQRVPRIALRGTGEQTVKLDGVHFGSYGACDVPPVLAQNKPEALVSAPACRYQTHEGHPTNTTMYMPALVEEIPRT